MTADSFERLTAALADRYRIERELGQGGMATVYLAHDVKHDRKVAIKVLRPELGAILGVERFLAEIMVTANLQHPNVLPLFDSGAAGDLLFYVMPFVEGESLRARLDREKQLPIADCIEIASAVGRALGHAHAHGVIHRDLKPENILLQDGQPLLADFGIALAVSRAGGKRVTESGMSLGTPQYMSPEQATADRTIDGRSDVFALGAVTYEMLTGDAPHTGSTAQAVIARIMTETPRGIRVARSSVPEHVERAVDKALAKLPADRFDTATAFAAALTDPTRTAGAAPARPAAIPSGRRLGRRELVGWAVAAIATSAAIYLGARPSPAAAARRLLALLPDTIGVQDALPSPVALSNDGLQLAIAGISPVGEEAIYLRRMDDTVARLVRGTEGGSSPAFSPDAKFLVFVDGSSAALRLVSVDGGASRLLADSVTIGRWVDNVRILYARAGTIWMISSDGTNRRSISKPDVNSGRLEYADPDPVPGGRFALVTIRRGAIDSSTVGILSLADGSVRDLGLAGLSARYAAPGKLLFARDGGRVFAIDFSVRRLAVSGEPTLLIEHVIQTPAEGATAFAVAQNGTLAYHVGSGWGTLTLQRVTRDGLAKQLGDPLIAFKEPRLSPDGEHVVLTPSHVALMPYSPGIRVLDVRSGAISLVSADSSAAHAQWTFDGSRVVYVRRTTDSAFIMSSPWDGSGAPRLMASGARNAFQDISLGPPGGFAVVRGPSGLKFAPLDSLAHLRNLDATAAGAIQPSLSPDGKLLAYTSNETGRAEVYIQQVPGPGSRVVVSVQGGAAPIWSRDGQTLFYRTATRVMSAAVTERPTLQVSHREPLFADGYLPDYDVFRNGDFLMRASPPQNSRVFVVLNWTNLNAAKSHASDGQ